MIVNIAASMEEEIVDINAEYERIFGSTPKPLLFDEDEYALLRKEIEESEYIGSRNIYEGILKHKVHQNLPFEGFSLTPYELIRIENNIESCENQRYNLFFVEKKQDSMVVARAAGYFNKQNNLFFVIEGSYCKETNYTKRLFKLEFRDYSKFFDCIYGYYIQRTTKSYNPDLAAKLFIGEMSTIKDWVNKDGLSLDSAYSFYRNQDVLEKVHTKSSIQTIKDEEKQDVSKETARTLSTIIRALMKHAQKQSKKDTYHLFYIKQDDCDATGYFNPEDEHFYICEGSIVSYIEEIDDRRKKFLIDSCKKFTTIKPTQCISASEAAYYVTGRVSAKHTVWRDENGRYLTNYYPKEQITKADKIEQDWSKHIFFINVGELKRGPLLASGIFNPDDKTFTLISGSWLSKEERTLLFKYGVYGRYRASIINGECSSYENGYLLKKNHKCPNCTLAAAAVLGAELDGTLAWKDKDGVGLGTWAQRKGVKL